MISINSHYIQKLLALTKHQLAQRTFVLFVFQGFAIVAGIASSFLIAKMLTPSQFGSYSYFVSVILVAGSCLPFGFDTLILREGTIFISKGQLPLLNGLIKMAYTFALFFSVFMVPSVFFILTNNNDSSIGQMSITNLIMCILSFTFLGFAILRQHLLQAMEFVSISQLIFNVARPMIIAIVAFSYWIVGLQFSFEKSLFIFCIASFITFVTMEVFYYSKSELIKNKLSSSILGKKWLVAASFLFIYDLLGNVGNNLDIFIVKQFLTETDTGVYAVCRKLSLLTTFGVSITGIAIRTKFSALYANNKIDQVQRLIRTSTKTIFLVFTPFVVILIFYGKEILNLIRPEYVVGYNALIILCLSELINLFFGPSTIFLLMTSHEKQANIISISNLFVQGILIYILVPYFGILGVSYAIVVSTMLKNLFIYYFIRYKTGIKFAAF